MGQAPWEALPHHRRHPSNHSFTHSAHLFIHRIFSEHESNRHVTTKHSHVKTVRLGHPNVFMFLWACMPLHRTVENCGTST